ncbi:MAG: tripartite tricarboxylate transporter permease [Pseudomonadota bacterium]
METILAGIAAAFTFWTVVSVLAGVMLGIAIGAIPGLNAPMAIAIAVPLTMTMDPLAALGMLVGVMKGGGFGGAISATLLNTPGEPSAVATALDAHPLARHQKKPRKAMKLALYSSVVGDTCSDITLFLVAAPLAAIAIGMGRVEQTSILLFSFTIIALLSGRSLLRGMIATLFGVLCALIGTISGGLAERFTFGIVELSDGLPLAAVAIGILAVPEVMEQIIKGRTRPADAPVIEESKKPEDSRVSLREFWVLRWVLARGAALGTFIGALPGLGSSVAAFLSYGVTMRASKTPERFGNGAHEGIAATESANSAVNGANLIPLLTLGIPGNVTAALLVGAFIIHGIDPGPRVFQYDAVLIYGLFTAMMMANLSTFVLGNVGLRLFAKVIQVRGQILYPTVLLLCVVGVYMSSAAGLTAIYIMIAFAAIGYLMRKFDFSVVCFIIGFVLGDTFEHNLRGTVTILYRDPIGRALEHPFAIFMVFATIAFVALILIGQARTGRKALTDTPVEPKT